MRFIGWDAIALPAGTQGVWVLVEFKVGNYRSFLTEQAIRFVATADPSHAATHCVSTRFQALPRLTRSAVLFGPNGSGKTNLLAALRTMREFVLHSPRFSETDYRHRYRPFREPKAASRPTTFSIDVVLKQLRYRYSFAFTAERIVAEDLRVYRSSKSQRWFGRRYDAGVDQEIWAPFSPAFPGAREMWRKATRPRALFLSTASDLGAQDLAPLMHWFEHQLDIAVAGDAHDLRPFAARLQDPVFKANVLRILQAVDLPVTDVRVSEAPAERVGTDPAPASIEFAYASAAAPPAWLDAREDSAGARRLVTLLSPILDGIERDRFVAIDEFDTHLHPLVARFLMQVINDPTATHRRVQVLLVSHTMSVMDLDILRRDEVWLLERDKHRAGRLSPLYQFSPRRHELVAKSYIKGNFGAIPRINFAESHFATAPASVPTALNPPVRAPRGDGLPSVELRNLRPPAG